jgi:hypothetical protein
VEQPEQEQTDGILGFRRAEKSHGKPVLAPGGPPLPKRFAATKC